MVVIPYAAKNQIVGTRAFAHMTTLAEHGLALRTGATTSTAIAAKVSIKVTRRNMVSSPLSFKAPPL
jgi:hypothetical protein